MTNNERVNILLVDDQPAKLLTYEAILRDLDENLISASGAREAFEQLLKHDIAVVLVDVYMPETDGFELAAMIREHPRFRETAIIFISAVLLDDVARIRGYEMGAVDYVPVPVIPEVLRAKVKVFIELYRKGKQLAALNRELEARVEERTIALASSASQLKQSERLRSLALAAGQMGSWEWNAIENKVSCDEGQCSILGVDSGSFVPTISEVRKLIHPDDVEMLAEALESFEHAAQTPRVEFRILRPNGEIRWCLGVAVASRGDQNELIRVSGVTIDITDRKLAEQRQTILAEEVDHRARNVVAVVQSIMRLTRADDIDTYLVAVDGRVRALSNAHKLLSRSRWEGADLQKLLDEELAPYRTESDERATSEGPSVLLQPSTAQTLALVLHELATNAAKYGALSCDAGRVAVHWDLDDGKLSLTWHEKHGPPTAPPTSTGYGTRVVRAGIEHQLGGQVSYDWDVAGLKCTMTFPIDAKAERQNRTGINGQGKTVAQKQRFNIEAGDQVLVVEDEPLVGMMLSDMLNELGLEVSGPFARLSDALLAAETGTYKAAILDVNLAGEKIYPVAAVLSQRSIPFVFVTGYGKDRIDSQFSEVILLQKPVERQKLRDILFEAHDGTYG